MRRAEYGKLIKKERAANYGGSSFVGAKVGNSLLRLWRRIVLVKARSGRRGGSTAKNATSGRSTGRAGYDTPSGDFQPFRMEKDHYSQEWDDAPMPNSIFFSKIGHAIHGIFESKNLGRPASHGCVRPSTQNAATLYALVQQEGVFNTRVRLTGDIPKSDSMEDTVARQNDDFQRVRQARGYYDDSRSYYYYRPQPYYERRYYNGRGFFPFGW
jgi:L,D-transpeptidase catalytic domain